MIDADVSGARQPRARATRPSVFAETRHALEDATKMASNNGLAAAAIDLLAATDPAEIRARLVRLGFEEADADRCTLTSIDQGVFRVEDSYEPGGDAAFVGHEYPLSYLGDQPLIRRAVSTGEVVTGGSLADGGRVDANLTAALGEIMHTAIVPLKLGPEVGALLILSRRRDLPFVAADLDQLRDVGNMAVLALHNARLLAGVNAAQRRGLDALTLISDHFASSSRLPDFFGRMSKSIAGLAGARGAAFWVVYGDRLAAQPDAHGFSAAQLAAMSVSIGAVLRGGLARVVHGGEALYWRRSAVDSLDPPVIAPPRTENLLAVPWRTAEGPLGLLVAYDSPAGFAEQDEWIMRLAARASALVWQTHAAQRRVNELQAAELERLQRHAERMAEVERQKSEFLKLASHELRGPITVLRGYLAMLKDGTIAELQPSVEETVAKMEAQVLHVKSLVDQMLMAARLEHSGLPITLYETRLDEVVRSVVAATETGPGSPRIVVNARHPVSALADQRHVEAMVSNLLSNALKYSPQGGDVVLSVRATADCAELDVSDRGIGIEPEHLATLFRPFSRVDEAEARGIDGVGLGLYVSRELARAQGGDITVRSEPGRGSVFTLRLPRLQPGTVEP